VFTGFSGSGEGRGGDVAVDGDAEVDVLGAAGFGEVGLASLLLAASRLTRSPSASPVQPSRSASAMRAWGLSRISSRRAVFWVAGYLIERFPDFRDFYLSMLDCNRRQIAKFEGGWPAS
jgi:hypothetical protein